MSDLIKAHVIEGSTGAKLAIQRISGCPRLGDEIRLPCERYYTVIRVVWCLDEDSYEGQRVNIGVVAVEMASTTNPTKDAP